MTPIHNFKVHLHVRPDAQYKIVKPKFVLYTLRSKIKTKLVRLKELGIISKVITAEFRSTTIVTVLKPYKQVRICGDFKITVNQYIYLT